MNENKMFTQGREGFIKIWDLNKFKEPLTQIQTSKNFQHTFCKCSYIESNGINMFSCPNDEESDSVRKY